MARDGAFRGAWETSGSDRAASARDSAPISDTVRGLVSLALCVHFAIVAMGLWSNFNGSPLQHRLLEFTAGYGITFNWVPYALRFHLTQGGPLDDDHQLVVREGGEGVPPGSVAGVVEGRWPLERVYLRRLALRLAEYQQGEDLETAAVLAGSVGARQMRQLGAARVVVRSERLEPALRTSDGGVRGMVAEKAYGAEVLLDTDGQVIVVGDTPSSEAAQAVAEP